LRAQIQTIQALRGAAVLLVVLHHFPYKLGIFENGYAGVDLFFVLSGFIMMMVTENNIGRPWDIAIFLTKRLTRIWPAYAVTSIAMLVFFCTVLGESWSSGTRQVFLDLLFYPPWPGSALNAPGWTLPFEVAFYVIFAFCLPAGKWRGAVAAASLLVGVYLLPLVSSSLADIFADGEWNGAVQNYFTLISAEICLGFVVGIAVWIACQYKHRVRAYLLWTTAAGASCWLAYLLFIKEGHIGHGLTWSLPCGLLLAALVLLEKQGDIRVPSVLVWLGNASFSIYIVHWAVVHPTYAWLSPQDFLSPGATAWLFIRYVTAIGLLAIVTHILLERRLSNWARDALLARIPTLRVSPPSHKLRSRW
jgi:exopolysaccharide production protein ExoZ